MDNLRAQAQHVFGVRGVRIEHNSALERAQDALPTSLLLAFGVIGALWLAAGVFRFAQVLLDLYILPGVPLTRFGAPKSKSQAGQGSWAVVTGATDGIGREFALQLGKKGFNVFLASRTPGKLSQVASEIEEAAPGIKTKTHSIDFSAGNDAQYAVLAAQLKDLDVGVLINNVGASHDMPVQFVETSEEEMLRIAEINVKATLRVTRIVAPGMVQKKRGLILNIGSFAGQYPVPLLATYAGSKSFLIAFSQALGEELRRSKVVVQNINAYFIVSKLSGIRRSSSMIPTPKQYVGRVLSKVGRSGGAVGRPYNSSPWPAHGLMDWAITSFVANTEWLLRYSYDNSLVVRKRALKKASKSQ